jgi:pimeloyl-ACP methyl ester carboxylesterase
LPEPSGPYAVATRTFAPIVDRSRPDARFASGARTLLVQLWYPTAQRTGDTALYIEDAALLDALKAESSAPETVESWRTLRTAAIRDASVAPGRFPLVFFSPGFGMARAYYTSWVEELASWGFFVAAVDHPFAGEARIDGRVLKATPHPDGPHGQTLAMATDLMRLLPILVAEPGVDGERVAAIGHSIGGAAALEACRLEPRIATAVNLDGDPSFGRFAELGVGKPYLVVHQKPLFPGARSDGELATLGRELDASWREIVARQRSPVLRLQVRGAAHLSFSDAPFVRPTLLADSGAVSDPLLVLRRTVAVVAAYLENAFAGRPDAALPLPELIVPAELGKVD